MSEASEPQTSPEGFIDTDPIDSAIDAVFTYQTFDVADLDPEPLAAVLSSFGGFPTPHQIVGAVTAIEFRVHLRVPQERTVTGKVLSALHAGHVVVVTGDIGAGKSTFAGELFDLLGPTSTKPIYINGDQIRGRHSSTSGTLPDLYRETLASQLEVAVTHRTRGGYTDDFLRFLLQNSDAFRGLQTAQRFFDVDVTARRPERDDLRAFHEEVKLWRQRDTGLVLRDLAGYVSKRHNRFAILLDNWDGFDFDQLQEIGQALAGTRLLFKGNTALAFLLRPSAEEALLDAVQFSTSTQRVRLKSSPVSVLDRRVKFVGSGVLKESLKQAHDFLQAADPNAETVQLDVFADRLGAAGVDLSRIFAETTETEIEYVQSADFRVVGKPAIGIVSEWQNNNIREVASSMRVYRTQYGGSNDRSTAVLRHILTYGGSSEDDLHEDLQLLMPDVDVVHGGLIHLRWRLLQYMSRRPDTAVPAQRLLDTFGYFEKQIEPVSDALELLCTRTGLETGFVRADRHNGVKVYSILPAGQWFVSGISHTVEYMFMLALADPRYLAVERQSRLLSDFSDRTRAEIAAGYVAEQLLADFAIEHPYLTDAYDLAAMSIADRRRLKEFARLFGYGASKGWFLSRFLRTLRAFSTRSGFERSARQDAAEDLIEAAIARLDSAAQVAEIQSAGVDLG